MAPLATRSSYTDLGVEVQGEGEAGNVIVQVDIVIPGSIPDTAGVFSCQDSTLTSWIPRTKHLYPRLFSLPPL